MGNRGDDRALDVKDVHVHYGRSHVLRGVSLHADDGEAIAVLGRNGAGKTTLAKALLGLAPVTGGSIRISGRRVDSVPAYRRVRTSSIGYVAQGHRVFPDLTVEENLRLPRHGRPGIWDVAAVYEVFPALKARRRLPAGVLSGGEQQLVAIGRALVTNPRLLVLDEPSEGLSAPLRERLVDVLGVVARQGAALLLVEQNLALARETAARAYLLSKGSIIHSGSSEHLLEGDDVLQRLFATIPPVPDG